MNNFLSEITLMRWIKEENEAYKRERERIKKLAIKEANKVKKIDYRKLPYLDVKVETKKICYHPEVIFVKKGTYKCKHCGMYLDISDAKIWGWSEKPKPNGNWVNGENLDKIKFPCLCNYKANSQRWKGEINKSWIPGEGTHYYLSSLNGQKECSIVTITQTLKELIEGYDIHILKGKIILFDEEE